MSDNVVQFVYGGKPYEIDIDPPNVPHHIRLPDRTTLLVRRWEETQPLLPRDMVVVEGYTGSVVEARDVDLDSLPVYQGRSLTDEDEDMLAELMSAARDLIFYVRHGNVELVESHLVDEEWLYLANMRGDGFVVISPSRKVLGLADSLDAEVVNAFSLDQMPQLYQQILAFMGKLVVGNYRLNDNFLRVFFRMLASRDLHEGMRLALALREIPKREELVAVAYDSKTGEPSEFEWRPASCWDGVVQKSNWFFKVLAQKVNPGCKKYVQVDGQVILVSHLPEVYHERGNDPEHIKLEFLDALE